MDDVPEPPASVQQSESCITGETAFSHTPSPLPSPSWNINYQYPALSLDTDPQSAQSNIADADEPYPILRPSRRRRSPGQNVPYTQISPTHNAPFVSPPTPPYSPQPHQTGPPSKKPAHYSQALQPEEASSPVCIPTSATVFPSKASMLLPQPIPDSKPTSPPTSATLFPSRTATSAPAQVQKPASAPTSATLFTSRRPTPALLPTRQPISAPTSATMFPSSTPRPVSAHTQHSNPVATSATSVPFQNSRPLAQPVQHQQPAANANMVSTRPPKPVSQPMQAPHLAPVIQPPVGHASHHASKPRPSQANMPSHGPRPGSPALPVSAQNQPPRPHQGQLVQPANLKPIHQPPSMTTAASCPPSPNPRPPQKPAQPPVVTPQSRPTAQPQSQSPDRPPITQVVSAPQVLITTPEDPQDNTAGAQKRSKLAGFKKAYDATQKNAATRFATRLVTKTAFGAVSNAIGVNLGDAIDGVSGMADLGGTGIDVGNVIGNAFTSAADSTFEDAFDGEQRPAKQDVKSKWKGRKGSAISVP